MGFYLQGGVYMRMRLLSVYCVSHFLVDFCCAFFMFTLLRQKYDWITAILIYNFCAFALQMPLGIAADKLSKNALFSALGCLLVAISPFMHGTLITASVMGIGNALFHVGGGVDVLNMSEHKCAPLGLFVSPGALGLCLGSMFAGDLPLIIPIALLVLSSALIILVSRFEHELPENRPLQFPAMSGTAILSVICLFVVVCLRSYAGMSFSFEWKSAIPAFITVVCIALGKALGGYAADKAGSRIASIISLSLCAALFLFSHIPICGLAALLLFNMTMPITLWETSKLFPDAKGFSFGLLTFALFAGFLPVYFGAPALTAFPSAAITALSLILLLAGIRRKKDNVL